MPVHTHPHAVTMVTNSESQIPRWHLKMHISELWQKGKKEKQPKPVGIGSVKTEHQLNVGSPDDKRVRHQLQHCACLVSELRGAAGLKRTSAAVAFWVWKIDLRRFFVWCEGALTATQRSHDVETLDIWKGRQTADRYYAAVPWPPQNRLTQTFIFKKTKSFLPSH